MLRLVPDGERRGETMADEPVQDATTVAEAPRPDDQAREEERRDDHVLEELLVEDVSIDGMCGVY
jgi:mycofactocin precursor